MFFDYIVKMVFVMDIAYLMMYNAEVGRRVPKVGANDVLGSVLFGQSDEELLAKLAIGSRDEYFTHVSILLLFF